jgi:hypothetical protein
VKTLAIILVILLVLAHPVAACLVLGAEAAVCSAAALLVCRLLRPYPYPYWRTA